MSVKKQSGLSDLDLYNAKVFLRSFNDALDCVKDNAMRQTAQAHYKDYISTLMRAMRQNRIMIDKNDNVVGAYA